MGNADRVFREDEGLQRIAVEDLASRTGMSVSDAFATLSQQPPPETPIHSGATVALSAGDELNPGP